MFNFYVYVLDISSQNNKTVRQNMQHINEIWGDPTAGNLVLVRTSLQICTGNSKNSTEQVSSTDNTSGLYSRGACFESRKVHQLYCLGI
jgi:hypothetical protein